MINPHFRDFPQGDPLPKHKLKIDSDQALKIASRALKGVILKSSEMRLERDRNGEPFGGSAYGFGAKGPHARDQPPRHHDRRG